MKILVIIEAYNSRRFLINLEKDDAICEVKRLISQKKNSQAIISALIKGRFEREVHDDRALIRDAELVLSESGARWDLAR